ncbi:GNAT family N-acetyltransferase [Streptomyces sp. AK02-01A]|uniref:GNAT family N-acetyltransferase n=1 Tax=Streptomyces sp. AK02-01A TaxID=3028648 RepID=UPI0029A762C4|nr:GNAT family N-acetyltransferase [Streptomyces sp. AK02-01A]MDX3849597.1 GNAT family N-acetyltransferase [Streptomyces sp. AK02-01A]MDX3849833.1 GNAT family N-acetyltransferase [Streptomyces sp. AK02-01A]
MTWQLTEDVEEFRRAADSWLSRDPARNTVLLTVSESLRGDGVPGAAVAPALFGWWRESENAPVSGAFIQTPPQPPGLGPMSARAAAELAGALRASGRPVPGVRGERKSAAAFAEEWTGGVVRAEGPGGSVGMRLFRLGALTPPRPAPRGRARLADTEDTARAAEWMSAFAADIGEPAGTDYTAATARRIEEGRLLLWEAEGLPVSMAGRTPLVAGQIRIAPVSGLSRRPRRARDDSYGASPRCRNSRIRPVFGRPSALRCTASDAAR